MSTWGPLPPPLFGGFCFICLQRAVLDFFKNKGVCEGNFISSQSLLGGRAFITKQMEPLCSQKRGGGNGEGQGMIFIFIFYLFCHLSAFNTNLGCQKGNWERAKQAPRTVPNFLKRESSFSVTV